MKQFACGSVVPGCQAVFTGKDEDEILGQVAEHAKADHGISDVSPELVESVRSNISAVG
jgi:predicted small metal-binding protein